MRSAPVTLVLALGLLVVCFCASSAAAAENRFHVVVVPVGSVPAAHLQQVDLALRRGITAAGGELLTLPAGALPKATDPATGECSEECEASMRSKPIGAALVLARVSSAGERFVLRVSLGIFRSDAASGLIAQLDDGAMRVGRRIASPDSVLLIKGGAKGAQWFLDGRPFTPAADRTIKVPPGRHVVRLGAGSGPGALKSVDVVQGDRIVLAFADGGDGSSAAGSRATTAVVVPPSAATTTKKYGAKEDAWSARTGLAFVSRTRSISGNGGAGYSTQFFGAGPEFTALFRPGPGVVRLDLAVTSYRFSSARFGTSDDNVTAHGGDSMRAAGMAGYEHDFGGHWSLAGFAGGGWETLRADDPRRLSLSPSYQRISLDAEVAASIRLGAARIGAHLGVSPWSSWKEQPEGASGVDAAGGLGISLGARTSVPLGDRWEGGVAYRGELRSARFKGRANAQVDPVIVDATVKELSNTVGLSLNRSF